MSLIKRIIAWFIALIKSIFGVSKKKKISTNLKEMNKKKLKMQGVQGVYNESLPSYMMIDEQDKLALIKKINELKETFLLSNKAQEINKIISLLKTNEVDINKISNYLSFENYPNSNIKRVNALLHEFSDISLKDIDIVIKDIENNRDLVNRSIKSLDGIVNYLENSDISFESKNIINDKISTLLENQQPENNFVTYDKDIINIINNWDKSIISEIETEYQTINYITISTVIIDRIMDKYRKIENDYQNHRYNRYYYEREINKIKDQIKYLKNLKNNHSVVLEIECLKKELYTKSKDKYDILYNNEVFISLENRGDKLLSKVNQKVIDLPKKEKKEETEKDDNIYHKKEYLENIIRRFQDLQLSRELIIKYQTKNINNKDILGFLDKSYGEFINGVDEPFNYQRNKAKTELVKLLNDLNSIVSIKNKSNFVSVDHINFQMSDLIDAVMVKKREVSTMINDNDVLESSQIVNDKINNFMKKFLLKEEQKRLIKKYDSSI